MTNYTWETGTGTWQTAGNWSPSGGPPGSGDTADVFNSAVITGTGSAAELNTNSGTVTLNGIFTLGTLYNGNAVVLEDFITAGYIKSFVSLDISGVLHAIGDTSAVYHGVNQYGGAVTIESSAYVQASQYSLIPYYTPSESLTINGTLDIDTFAAYDPNTGYLIGGMDIAVASQVRVQNGGSLSTTYLTMEDPNAVLTIDAASAEVTQTSTSDADLVGIQLDAGTIALQNEAALDATYLGEQGIGQTSASTSEFIVDASSATISADDDEANGFLLSDGNAAFRDGSAVTLSELYVGPSPENYYLNTPTLSVSASALDITGAGGALIDYGSLDIIGGSEVHITADLRVDSPDFGSEDDTPATNISITGGSFVRVDGDVLLGQNGYADVGVTLSGSSAAGASSLAYGGVLAVGYGGYEYASGYLAITNGATVAPADQDALGLVYAGYAPGATGAIDVDGADSFLLATDMAIGEAGDGDVLLTNAGSLLVEGTLVIGDSVLGVGGLQVAGIDGPAEADITGSLVVGNAGSGDLVFTSSNALESGVVVVGGDATFGDALGGYGTALALGGTFGVVGNLVVGNAGSADVYFESLELQVLGSLSIGNSEAGGTLYLIDTAPTLTGDLIVGDAGTGDLDWAATDTQMTQLDLVVVGNQATGEGTFQLLGTAVEVDMQTLVVGNEGFGTFHIFDGAGVDVVTDGTIGAETQSGGLVSVDTGLDSGSDEDDDQNGGVMVVEGSLTVGDNGSGTLFVGSEDPILPDTGTVGVGGDLIIGNAADSDGYIVVANTLHDAASMLIVGGDVYVGVEATGSTDIVGFLPGAILQIDDGAEFYATGTEDSAGVVFIGVSADSSGVISVDGGTADFRQLVVGNEGDGELLIDGGGSVAVYEQFTVGDSADATGLVDVSGTRSLLDTFAELAIGGSASAYTSGGTIEYPAELDVSDGGTLTNYGTGTDGIVIAADAHSLAKAVFNTGTLLANSIVVGQDGSGVLELTNQSQGTLYDDLLLGTGTAGFGGVSVDDSGLDFAGAIDVGETATGARVGSLFIPGGILTISDGATLTDTGSDGIGIAVGSLSTGFVQVDDADVAASDLAIGVADAGTMFVQNDGSVEIAAGATTELAIQEGSNGTLLIDSSDFIFGDALVVGDAGAGTLTVQDAALVRATGTTDDGSVELGLDKTGTGQVLVDGATFDALSLTVGDAGSATMTVLGGSTLAITNDATLGSQTDSSGLVILTESTAALGGGLVVGDLGSGTLALSNAATLIASDEIDVGVADDGVGNLGAGTITATGTDTSLQADGGLVLGSEGSGSMVLSFEAAVKSKSDVTLGDKINSTGALTISGASFEVSGGSVIIGSQGTGNVVLNGLADFNAGSVDVTLADNALGSGTLDLGKQLGAASAETGDLVIGAAGTGAINIHAGSTLTTTGDATIADSGSGSIVIEGTNTTADMPASTWTVSGDLSIGGTAPVGTGSGTLVVANSGTAHIAGSVTMWHGGTIIDNSASLGLIEIGGTTADGLTGLVIDADGSLAGAGTIEAAAQVDGTVTATGGLLVIYGSVTGTGTLEIAPSATLALPDPDPTIDFLPGGPGSLDLGGTSATIDGLSVGDVIVLEHFAAGTSTFSNGTFDLSGTNTTSGAAEQVLLSLGTVDGTPSYHLNTSTHQTVVEDVACYLRGTHILTARGEVRVEDLREGDRLITRTGHRRKLRWIARRAYDLRFAGANPQVLPVMIRAGAIAEGVPARDLYVSACHALYLDDMLIPAGELVNGSTIRQVHDIAQLEYFHLELAHHDVIVAEGAWAESYLDRNNRRMFHNAGDTSAPGPTSAAGCAPRCEQGPAVAAVRARLASRAAELGYHRPATHRIALDQVGLIRAVVPAGVTEVHMHSPVGYAMGDYRPLGALLLSLALDGRPIGLGHPRLLRGWHGIERHDGQVVRWTNGEAAITLDRADVDQVIEIRVGTLIRALLAA
jgi:T5SS/PEP-CTERM-associated repeat protein